MAACKWQIILWNVWEDAGLVSPSYTQQTGGDGWIPINQQQPLHLQSNYITGAFLYLAYWNSSFLDLHVLSELISGMLPAQVRSDNDNPVGTACHLTLNVLLWLTVWLQTLRTAKIYSSTVWSGVCISASRRYAQYKIMLNTMLFLYCKSGLPAPDVSRNALILVVGLPPLKCNFG